MFQLPLQSNLDSLKVDYAQVACFVMMITGYELVSFLPELLGMEESKPLSVGYRGINLLIYTYVIFKNRVHLSYGHLVVHVFFFIYGLKMLLAFVTEPYIFPKEKITELWTFFFFISWLQFYAFCTEFNVKTLQKIKEILFIFLMIFCISSLVYNATVLSGIQEREARVDANKVLNTITLGYRAAILVIVSLHLFGKKMLWKILATSGVIIGMLLIFLAASRGPLIALVLGLIMNAIFSRKVKNLLYFLIGVSLTIAVAMYVPQTKDYTSLLLERILETGYNKNDSDIVRANLVRESWKMFMKNPILGDLPLIRSDGTGYPHNHIIESLQSTGLIGGIFYIIIFVMNIYFVIKYMYLKEIQWVIVLHIMNIVAVLTSGSIYMAISFWALTGWIINVPKFYLLKKTE